MRHFVVEAFENLVDRPVFEVFGQTERLADVEFDLGDDAEHSHRYPGCGERVRILGADLANLASGKDDAELGRHCREALLCRTGAVRGGADRTGDLLGVDIPLILKTQPGRPQWVTHLPDRGSRGYRDTVAGSVDRGYPGHPVQAQHHSVGHRQWREGVPRPDGAHAESMVHGVDDGILNVGLRARMQDPLRSALLIAGPV